jgi:hypothetical protein
VLELPEGLSPVYLVQAELTDAGGKVLSENVYWHAVAAHPDDLTALNTLPEVTLDAAVARKDADGVATLTVTLKNTSATPALMTHLQLHEKQSGARVLPVFYSDNYVSLMPGEAKTVTITAAVKEVHGDALVLVDGWNVTVKAGAGIAQNVNAQPAHWPETGLPFQTVGLR